MGRGLGDSAAGGENKFARSKLTSAAENTLICLLAALLLTTAPIADAQQATKVPRVGVLLALSHSAISDRIEAFARVCATLDTSRGKPSPLSIDMPMGNSSGCPISRRSLPGSKSTLSSRAVRRNLSSQESNCDNTDYHGSRIPTLLATDSSPA